PIKANFREGLTVLEYFSSTHGARKGLADTALKTADSGYLTRKLADVAQNVVITMEDCGTAQGITKNVIYRGEKVEVSLAESITGRVSRQNIVNPITDEVIVEDSGLITPEIARRIEEMGLEKIQVRSPMTCDAPLGICRRCYGMDLATGTLVEEGMAVGIIAAQSIGEPGTQLTMRTFHIGGVAGGADIAGGLPRVVELFEARSPKGKATLARTTGVVRIGEDEGKGRVVTIVSDDGTEDVYTVPGITRLEVSEGDEIEAGDAIVEGARDPKELLEIRGVRETQTYLVEQVQKVYREQGVSIHDKHIELIVRQMTRRVTVLEPGDSDFLPGERVDQKAFADANKILVEEGRRPAEGRVELMGITKASLATDSWLSAASFQETTRVLTDAAIGAKTDNLMGLKENVILGKLIPAGTGMSQYRHIRVEPTEEAKEAMYPSFSTYDDLAYPDAGFGDAQGEAVRLEEYDARGGYYDS
ncbi:MAG: DNA-directed RNA polymerase subunit beta', partial [Actinobacteria bacterium]|nr:DNA-directed RNA polymerase subunit beta' [Actinomycetota bacterium]